MATPKQQEETMTFEQIEAHVKKANLDQFVQPASAAGALKAGAAQLDLAGTLKKVCGVYKGIRPILKAVLIIPLIPESLKKPLRTFTGVMDGVCV